MSIVIPETDNAVIDGNFLEACLKRRLASLVSEANENMDFSMFETCLKSPEVWVKDPSGEEVRSVNSVIRMLHSLTDLQQVTYHGYDHDKVVVLNGALPSDWQAQVKNVMVRHLPSSLIAAGADRVFLAEMLPYGKAPRGKRKLVARGVPGGAISTNSAWENVPKKEIVKYYHNVTLKLTRAESEHEQMLLSWLPGLDVKSNVCDGLEGCFVELQDGEQFVKVNQPSRLRFKDLR